LNKLPQRHLSNFKTFNLDGHDFIIEAHNHFSKNLHGHPPEHIQLFDHYIMNLPASALSFLSSFYGLARNKTIIKPSNSVEPTVHCYLFARLNEDPMDLLRSNLLDFPLKYTPDSLSDSHVLAIHNVRRVAPNKEMFCISFRLPEDFLHASWSPESVIKRPRLEPENRSSNNI
jgi:tRNA G37 N-methylase Trm5